MIIRDSLGRFAKGTTNPWNKGITGYKWKHPSPLKGVKKSIETRKRMSIAMMGNQNPVGTKRTLEHRKIISEMNRQRVGPKNGNFGKKLPPWQIEVIRKTHSGKIVSESTRAKLRARQYTRKNFHDTNPERILHKALKLEGIIFVKQKPFTVNGRCHFVDIFIEPNICVEVDGEYWHRLPHKIKRDIEVNDTLEKQDFIVVRFWETEIYKSPSMCVRRILGVMRH